MTSVDDPVARLLTQLTRSLRSQHDYVERVTQVRQMFGDTAAINLILNLAERHEIELDMGDIDQ